MAENSRGQFGERFIANVHSKLDDLERRIKEPRRETGLQGPVRKASLSRSSGWLLRMAEGKEKAGFPCASSSSLESRSPLPGCGIAGNSRMEVSCAPIRLSRRSPTNGAPRPIHNRMPVMLTNDDARRWLAVDQISQALSSNAVEILSAWHKFELKALRKSLPNRLRLAAPYLSTLRLRWNPFSLTKNRSLPLVLALNRLANR